MWKSKPIRRWVVCSIVLQHSNWKKSKQGREQQRVLVHVRSNVRAQQRLLQKVEGDKGVLENLLSFCVNKSGRRGQKKSCSAAAAKIQREIKDKTKLSDFSWRTQIELYPSGSKHIAEAMADRLWIQILLAPAWWEGCQISWSLLAWFRARFFDIEVLEPFGISSDEHQIGWWGLGGRKSHCAKQVGIKGNQISQYCLCYMLKRSRYVLEMFPIICPPSLSLSLSAPSTHPPQCHYCSISYLCQLFSFQFLSLCYTAF